ncbi:MAG: molecular chaperone TorD family protein [Omnitrophica bacterium]|nr:molecular chaperone TorD family protein [Candidatus Omnitrophota bacterium]
MKTDENTQMNVNSALYSFFATIFAKEPTCKLLEAFKQDENRELFSSCGIDPLSDIRDLSLERQKEVLEVEYARLFLVPPVAARLRESLRAPGEGKLWGESTVRVNRIYEKFGFKLDKDFKDTPDHLSAELSFLAELSKLESEYASGGLKEARKGVMNVKKYFLNNHILAWFPGLKDDVDKHATFCYYKDISRLLGMVLNEEKIALTGGE